MKPMKVLAAMAAVSFACAAQAVEIKFEFSGTIFAVYAGDEAYLGQTAVGQFVIETDNFSLLSANQYGATWTDTLPFNARPDRMSASLSLGSENISFDSEVELYGGIGFTDGCRPDCQPFDHESWSVGAYTQSFPLGGQPSPSGYSTSSLTFSSAGFDSLDFLDSTVLTPQDLLNLPLARLNASYNRWDYTCADGQCDSVKQFNAQFVPTSVARTLVTATAVPEPGSLGLFGAALLGMGALSLRRRAATTRA